MTVRRVLGPLGLDGVSFGLPALAVVAAVVLSLAGQPLIGAGIAVGAVLALLNSSLLIKRIDLAVRSGNPAAALISMQLGLLVTFTIVGAVTVLMLLSSVRMTVAMAISFFIAQTAELLLFYWARQSRAIRSPSMKSAGDDR